MLAQPPLSRRARHMHLGRCHPRRDLSPAHAFTRATELYPLRGTASPHRRYGIKEIFRHGARGREGRHAVRTRREWPASNSGVQRRLRLQKCKAFGVSFLFAPAGIFVHVCRRCQRADRAGGIHVGLIFCNFSIKRKVKEYNYLRDWHLPQSTMLLFAISNREVSFHNHICSIR